mgnify:CR=1 FL=1
MLLGPGFELVELVTEGLVELVEGGLVELVEGGLVELVEGGLAELVEGALEELMGFVLAGRGPVEGVRDVVAGLDPELVVLVVASVFAVVAVLEADVVLFGAVEGVEREEEREEEVEAPLRREDILNLVLFLPPCFTYRKKRTFKKSNLSEKPNTKAQFRK